MRSDAAESAQRARRCEAPPLLPLFFSSPPPSSSPSAGQRGCGRAGWLIPDAAAIAVAAVMIGSAWAGGLIGAFFLSSSPPLPALRSCPGPAKYRGVAPGCCPARGIGGSPSSPLFSPRVWGVADTVTDIRYKKMEGALGSHIMTRQRQLNRVFLPFPPLPLSFFPLLLPGRPISASRSRAPEQTT